jgi:hypothetical protein
MTKRTETGVMMVTTARAFVGTRPAESLHGGTIAEDAAKPIVICVTSSTPEMHAAELKAGAEIGSVKSKNSATKGTMIIIVLTMTNITISGTHPRRLPGIFLDMEQVWWPVNFKPSGIEKYDGSTNPTEWLKLYQLAIEAAGGDSYVMANYLSVYLSSSARTWHLGLPARSVWSWNHLRRLFTSNFYATCAWLSVDGDLASVVQKKGVSHREYIQCFYNKRNVILEVDDKSIMMFFKKWLRDSSLIQKLTMKNPRMSEQMFSIANTYALAKEVTLDTREQRNESGH